MRQRVFLFDYQQGCWREDESQSAYRVAEALPVVFFDLRPGNESDPATWKQWVWCSKHHCREEIVAKEFHRVTTKKGCQEEGILLGIGSNDYVKEGQGPTIRWRVSYIEERGLVSIMADVLSAEWADRHLGESLKRDAYKGRFPVWKTKGVSLQLEHRRVISLGVWEDVPDCAADAALEFLQEEGQRLYGVALPIWRVPQPEREDAEQDIAWFRPNGYRRIKAFMEYPNDMEMGLLFEGKIFSRDCSKDARKWDSRNSFQKLCALFHVEPTEEMHHIYRQNPYLLPLTGQLYHLGVRSSGLVKKFYPLCKFCGSAWQDPTAKLIRSVGRADSAPDASVFCDEEALAAHIHGKQYFYPDESLSFYCRWILAGGGTEEDLAERLLELQLHWVGFPDLELLYKNFLLLPKAFRKRLIKERFSEEMIREMNALIEQANASLLPISYSEKERAYECEIDGYEFRLLESEAQFKELYRNEHHEPSADGVLIVNVFRDRMAKACIRLQKGEWKLIFRDHSFGSHTWEERLRIRVSCLHWFKWTGLFNTCYSFYEDDYNYLEEDVAANPLNVGVDTGGTDG